MIAILLINYTSADCTGVDESICTGLTGGVFIASPISCQGWVQCHENAIIRCGDCPNGQYFDSTLGGCFYSSLVNCAIQPPSSVCTPGLINRVPREDSCSIYYQCIGEGDPIEQRCSEGLHFNEHTEQCDFIDKVRCLREPIVVDCPATEEPFTQEPHPWLCERFFVCIDGVGTERECLEGMLFDVNLRQCQFADRAECVESSVAPVLATQMEVMEKAEDNDDEVYVCSEEPYYYVAVHPTDCQKYVQCIYGVANIHSCVDGTLFHPENLRCDLAENVECVV